MPYSKHDIWIITANLLKAHMLIDVLPKGGVKVVSERAILHFSHSDNIYKHVRESLPHS